MQKFKKLITAPYPFIFGWSDVLIPAFLVLFILLVMAPFGFSNYPIFTRFWLAFPFGIITAGSVLLHFFLFQFLLNNSKENWHLGKELIYNFSDMVFIGFWNTLYIAVSRQASIPFLDLFVIILLHTFLIGILPVLALMLYKKNKALKSQLQTVEQANKILQENQGSKRDASIIDLLNENEKLEISLLAEEIICFCTEGNYVDVFYSTQNSEPQKHLLRNRLKAILTSLPPNFLHCHRRFVINLDKIQKVEGNARELKVYLRGYNFPIPVSRSKAAELLEKLNVHKAMV